MARRYIVGWTGTVTNAGGNVDLIDIAPAANKPIRLRGMIISQISEVAEAAEEGLDINVLRLRATVTTTAANTASDGGAINAVDPVDTACGATVTYNNTTVATTSGNTNDLGHNGWNVRNTPFEKFWERDEAPYATNGMSIIVRQNTAAADDYTAQFTFFLEEG